MAVYLAIAFSLGAGTSHQSDQQRLLADTLSPIVLESDINLSERETIAIAGRRAAADPLNVSNARRRRDARARRSIRVRKHQRVMAQQRGALGQFIGGGGAGGDGRSSVAGNLVDLIEQHIEPESWETNGGPGTIGVFHR